MKQQPLRAVFFDVGGTLLRPYPSIGTVYATVGERHGFVAGAEEWERAFRAAWGRARAVEGGSLTTAEKRWWRMLVFHALEGLKLRKDDAAGNRFFEDLFAAFAREDCTSARFPTGTRGCGLC